MHFAAIGCPRCRHLPHSRHSEGVAQDLLVNGASLAEILSAGQWKSPAFLAYLDLETLEKGAVIEAHRDESSSDDEG